MNIDKMPAGHEMDALVAEKVMGLEVAGSPERRLHHRVNEVAYPVPRYSTDIAAAWEALEVASKKVNASFNVGLYTWPKKHYNVQMSGGKGWGGFGEANPCVQADTAPLAICRAALKAAGL